MGYKTVSEFLIYLLQLENVLILTNTLKVDYIITWQVDNFIIHFLNTAVLFCV